MDCYEALLAGKLASMFQGASQEVYSSLVANQAEWAEQRPSSARARFADLLIAGCARSLHGFLKGVQNCEQGKKYSERAMHPEK